MSGTASGHVQHVVRDSKLSGTESRQAQQGASRLSNKIEYQVKRGRLKIQQGVKCNWVSTSISVSQVKEDAE